jgi:predicted hydrolase (HD superfamily)
MASFERSHVYALLTEHTKSPNLVKHMVAVEVAMRAYAEHFGEDPDRWGAIGLLHDHDYESHPFPAEVQARMSADPSVILPEGEYHPWVGVRRLRQLGYDEEFCDAILAHAEFTGVPRASRVARALYAVDELCGLITAAALIRPDRDVRGVELPSLKKKFKDKAFARGVHRDQIRKGVEELGVELDEHMQFTLDAMKGAAGELGLDGRAG